MPKKSFEDIIPPTEKRTIRNIENSHSKKTEKREDRPRRVPEYAYVERSRTARYGLWAIAIIVVIVLVFSFSFLFSGAQVSIIPKQSKTLVDANFEAAINADQGEFAYQVMTIEKIDSRKVPAASKEEVEEKASGKIMIFNDFSSANQRLIKNTRFETPEGLIYRINKSVVVPGQTTEDGEKIPGSIEVTVYADEPGSTYNIGLTDFTIPGFKGGARYESFYARSKTSMTGGFAGEKLIASPEDIEKAKEEIHAELQKQLLNDAYLQKSEDFYLFEDTIFTVFESQPQVEEDGEVAVVEKVTLYGVLFNKEDFSGNIAENTLAIFDDESVEIADIETLSVTVVDKEDARPWEDEEFTFHVSGSAHIVWTFDEEQLKNDLLGKAKAALPTVLSGYPSINEAEVVLRPFWKRSFPDKIDKISIERSLE